MPEITVAGTTLHFAARPRVKSRLQQRRLYRRLLLLHSDDGTTTSLPAYLSNHLYSYAFILTYARADEPVAWFVATDSDDTTLLAALDAYDDWYEDDYLRLETFVGGLGKDVPPVDQAEIDDAARGLALAMLGVDVIEDDDTPDDDRPFTHDAATLTRCWVDLHQRNLYPEKGGYLEQDEALLHEVERFGTLVYRHRDAYKDDERLAMQVDVGKYTDNGTASTELFNL
ncbi:MAG: hypothetical protein ACPG7F_01175 [Aggregatilineales bacterium]